MGDGVTEGCLGKSLTNCCVLPSACREALEVQLAQSWKNTGMVLFFFDTPEWRPFAVFNKRSLDMVCMKVKQQSVLRRVKA